MIASLSSGIGDVTVCVTRRFVVVFVVLAQHAERSMAARQAEG
jgi:hypothetical protein